MSRRKRDTAWRHLVTDTRLPPKVGLWRSNMIPKSRLVGHLFIGGLAGVIAASISVLSVSFLGPHNTVGVFAGVAGFPGLLVNGVHNPFSPTRYTAGNWVFYFLLIEASALLSRVFSRKHGG